MTKKSILEMFSFFFYFTNSALIRYNSLIQLENSYSKTKLGIVYQEDDARFKKPTIVSFVPPFDNTWNWAILSPYDDKSTDQVMCGDDVYLYNSYRDMFLNTRFDQKQERNIVFASRIPNQNISLYKIDCPNGKPFQTDIEFSLQNIATKCFLYTDFTQHHPELTNAYLVNCSYISQKSIWSVKEGLFIIPKETPNPESQEISNEL